MTGVACILCSGTDYAADCGNGQCHAEQLDLIDGNRLNDPGPPQTCATDSQNCVQVANWRGFCLTHPVDEPLTLPDGRHERGWPHG